MCEGERERERAEERIARKKIVSCYSLLVIWSAISTVSSYVVKRISGTRNHGRIIMMTRTHRTTCALAKGI